MRRIFSAGIVGLTVTILGMTSVSAQNKGGSAEGKRMKNPVGVSAASIAAGKALYTKSCQVCHNADAKGDGPMAPKDTHPSDLTDAKWDRGATDGEIFAVIRDGAGPKFDMKGYKSKMTETEIWNVVNYIRSVQAK